MYVERVAPESRSHRGVFNLEKLSYRSLWIIFVLAVVVVVVVVPRREWREEVVLGELGHQHSNNIKCASWWKPPGAYSKKTVCLRDKRQQIRS